MKTKLLMTIAWITLLSVLLCACGAQKQEAAAPATPVVTEAPVIATPEPTPEPHVPEPVLYDTADHIAAVPSPVLTPAPTPLPTPVPAATPAPTPVPGPPVVITKNPTSESLSVGGKTWFIAHADNATSMTWEMVDVNGNIYSLADATAMHPGLRLEALEGDTIAVSNVPASVNGWAVQATFYGQGGSVSTSPAYIYVGDFLKSYSSIIDQYRYAVSLGADINAQITYDLGISECVTYSEKVGYALKDLDKNGIPELMIGGINYYWEDAPMVYDLYTLNSINQPVQLCVSWPRSRNYLLIDNRIMNEGSGGASSSGFILKKVNGTSLEFLEGYWSSNSTDNSGTTMYHTTVEDNGFFDVYDDTMPSQQGFAVGEALKEKAWMPQLTVIE